MICYLKKKSDVSFDKDSSSILLNHHDVTLCYCWVSVMGRSPNKWHAHISPGPFSYAAEMLGESQMPSHSGCVLEALNDYNLWK